MALNLVACVELIELGLQLLFGVNILLHVFLGLRVFLLKLALAASIPAATKTLEQRYRYLREVWGEDIEHQGQTELLANLGVPKGCEIRIGTIEDRDKTQKQAVDEVKVNKQHHKRNIDKLHDGNLLKLAFGLVIDR